MIHNNNSFSYFQIFHEHIANLAMSWNTLRMNIYFLDST